MISSMTIKFASMVFKIPAAIANFNASKLRINSTIPDISMVYNKDIELGSSSGIYSGPSKDDKFRSINIGINGGDTSIAPIVAPRLTNAIPIISTCVNLRYNLGMLVIISTIISSNT